MFVFIPQIWDTSERRSRERVSRPNTGCGVCFNRTHFSRGWPLLAPAHNCWNDSHVWRVPTLWDHECLNVHTNLWPGGKVQRKPEMPSTQSNSHVYKFTTGTLHATSANHCDGAGVNLHGSSCPSDVPFSIGSGVRATFGSFEGRPRLPMRERMNSTSASEKWRWTLESDPTRSFPTLWRVARAWTARTETPKASASLSLCMEPKYGNIMRRSTINIR